jgi:predicted nucleic acid-binding protein
VVVAAVASWHEGHRVSGEAVARGVQVPAHCLLEAYSVLTRLPPPHRLEARTAAELLARRFPGPALVLSDESRSVLLGRLAAAGIAGGGAYDGLVGLTAASHDALLLSRDRRAAPVYAALGVRFELLP